MARLRCAVLEAWLRFLFSYCCRDGPRFCDGWGAVFESHPSHGLVRAKVLKTKEQVEKEARAVRVTGGDRRVCSSRGLAKFLIFWLMLRLPEIGRRVEGRFLAPRVTRLSGWRVLRQGTIYIGLSKIAGVRVFGEERNSLPYFHDGRPSQVVFPNSGCFGKVRAFRITMDD